VESGLRRNAIHTNYRAVLDILPAGGYGNLWTECDHAAS